MESREHYYTACACSRRLPPPPDPACLHRLQDCQHSEHPKMPKKSRTAALPAGVKKSSAKDEAASPFAPEKRNFGIGGAIQPRRDLSRMLKWPRHIRIQRQRKVLNMRLKVPPSIAQFAQTLDLNMGTRQPP